MVRLSASILAGLAVTAVSFTGAATLDPRGVPSDVVAGAFILECESSQNLESLIKVVQDQGGEIRREFNSKVFYGLSVQLPNATMAGHKMEHMTGVINVWPVQVTKQPVESQPAQEPGHQRRGINAPWNHIMTQVDKLHADGFMGSGIQIAVVDTGIDYTHPALGGCFGKGCRVAIGDNFSKDGKKNDPMDCNGHGTAVAGIVAGSDSNYVGVAPNTTLAGYRVADCSAGMEEDDIMAGWVRAYEDGAQIIVSSIAARGSSWSTRPMAAIVSRIVDAGVPCIAALGNEADAGLFSAGAPSSGRGVTSVNAFARAPGALDGRVKDAPMAILSTYGPNWELDIKPTVGAPGDDVPGIEMGGGYKTISGTSFACPLVGGILALMAEVRGTFKPLLLNSLLVSTAVPQGGPFSVAQQGGGLVRAWDAAHATTLVEPASLSFNDTRHRVQSLSLRITNTAKADVTYHLESLAAETLYTLRPGSDIPEQSPPVKDSADIKLSQRVLVLGPNKSASVDISATDPKGLDASRLPVWSGWIAINSSNNGLLTVPYLGLFGSLKEHRVLAPKGAVLTTLVDGWQDMEHYDGDEFNYEIKNDSSLSLTLPLRVKPSLGTRLVRADVVPVSPRKWLADRLGAKNIKLNAFTLEALSHTQATRKTWNGRLEWGDYIPVGEYKLAVRALRLFGDPNVESDWDVSETVRFKVAQGAGKKACEIYEPGIANIPKNALFDSHQECHQVHGNVLVDAPWIPAPQNKNVSNKCTDDNPTEEFCGTYRFCKAHKDVSLLPGLKSPFSSFWSCIRSHKTLPVKELDSTRIPECFSTKDESICGTIIWCSLKFSSAQRTDEYGSSEECNWAHGIF